MIREARASTDGVAYLCRQAEEKPSTFLALLAMCLDEEPAPTPPDGGTRLTIVRADGGERKAA